MTLDAKQQTVLNDLLLEAVKNNDAAHVRLYVEKGADVNAQFDQWMSNLSDYKKAPLYHLLSQNSFSSEISDFLLSHGVDVDVKDYGGNTRLMLAVKECKLGLVKYFISKGAQPLETNNRGEIVLDQARQLSTQYSDRQAIIDTLVKAIDAPAEKTALAPPVEKGDESEVATRRDIKMLPTIEFAPRKKGGGLNL